MIIRIYCRLEKTKDFEIYHYRFDNEFDKTAIQVFAQKYNIEFELSVLYDYYQIEMAECIYYTVRDKISVIIQDYIISSQIIYIVSEKKNKLLQNINLPEKLWPETIQYFI